MYKAFDLDGGGDVGEEEMLALGQVRLRFRLRLMLRLRLRMLALGQVSYACR